MHRTETCWLWTGATRNFGYGVINMGGRNGKIEAAHRVSWMLYVGEIPAGAFVCHRCDVPLCVNPSHLFIGTASDNVRDMVSKGRHDKQSRTRGERHWASKLTESDVRAIRSERAHGDTLKAIASRHGVSLQAVWRIVQGEHWRHV